MRAQVCVRHRVKEAAHPRLGLDPVLRPGQMDDVAVTEPDQVLGGEARPGDLVGGEAPVLGAPAGLQADVRHT